MSVTNYAEMIDEPGTNSALPYQQSLYTIR